MIYSIKFRDINQHDDVYITVDKRSDKVIYENERWLNDNERLFVKIYDDGFAHYGLEMTEDPAHNNQRYIWSSNPSAINEYFNLIGTDYELAIWDIGVKELHGRYSCYMSAGVLLNSLLPFVEANQERLKYGYWKFFKANTRRTQDDIVIYPRKGLYIDKDIHDIEDTYYVGVKDEEGNKYLVRISDLQNYVYKYNKSWSLGELMGTVLTF